MICVPTAFIGCLFLSTPSVPSETVTLEVSSTDIQVCDPVFCSITLTNNHREPLVLKRPIDNEAGSLSFEVLDEQNKWRRVTLPREGAGCPVGGNRTLGTGETLMAYECLFENDGGLFFRQPGKTTIRARVGVPKRSVYSNPITINVKPRPAAEEEFILSKRTMFARAVNSGHPVFELGPAITALDELHDALSHSDLKRLLAWQKQVAAIGKAAEEDIDERVAEAIEQCERFDSITRTMTSVGLATKLVSKKQFEHVPPILELADDRWPTTKTLRISVLQQTESAGKSQN